MDKMKSLLGILILSVFVLIEVDSFSTMVPQVRSVCKKMLPGHDGIAPQGSTSPFILKTDINEVNMGKEVKVTITAPEGKHFKGFYIQGRDEDENPIGTFKDTDVVGTHDCGDIESNAAHHTSPAEKNKVEVSWIAPDKYKGAVKFVATVVEKYNTFWTPIKAENLVTIS